MNGFLHQSLHHTLQQAVEWVQNSPPIFNRSASPLFLGSPLPAGLAPVNPDTEELDILASLVNQKGNPLLGIFYETLWQFLLSQLPDNRIMASNLQVKGKKNGQPATLGEYDIIYQLRNQFIHRELAVKFYLGIPGEDINTNGSPWHNWVGPGLKDRLDRKIDRLLHHQAILSDTNEGQEALLKLGIEQPVQKEILVQGRLFYPLYPLGTNESAITPLTDIQGFFQSEAEQIMEAKCQPPEFCNPNHLKGYWLTQSQFLLSTQPITKNVSFQIPHKIQWLNQKPVAEFLNHDELLHQLKKQAKPVYVRAFQQKQQEQMHLFILPDNWPEKAEEVSRQ